MAKEIQGNGLVAAVEMKRPQYRILYWLVFAFVLAVAFVCLVPPLWILLSAFKDTEEFLRVPPTLFPEHIRLGKIAEVWSLINFKSAYVSSVCMAAGDIAFCLIFNGLAGYVISRLKPKGIGVFAAMIMVTMMLPTSVSMVPLFMTFINFPVMHANLTDTYLPMWMMAGANAFYVLLFKSFFDSISSSYLEAARIDGCGNIGIFVRIIMPMSKPIFFTVGLFTATGSWGNFLWPYLVIKSDNMVPVSVAIFKLRDKVPEDVYMMSLIFVIIIPAVLFICFQKHIMEGFTIGGVKE